MGVDGDLAALVEAVATHLGVPIAGGRVLSRSTHLVVEVEAGGEPVVVRRVQTLPRVGAGSAADAHRSLRREVEVASHLDRRGVDVVRPRDLADPGPHPSSVGWYTLWERAEHDDRPITPARYRGALDALHDGLAGYGDLPRLGAWGSTAWARATLAAAPLRPGPDRGDLEAVADAIDAELARRPDAELVPSHGDAHPRNLMRRGGRPAWNDLEDVSAMPPRWDESCVLARALLLGYDTALADGLVEAGGLSWDEPDLRLALAARIVNVTLLGCALEALGLEDPAVAGVRVERAAPLLRRLGWT